MGFPQDCLSDCLYTRHTNSLLELDCRLRIFCKVGGLVVLHELSNLHNFLILKQSLLDILL
jgi:hypothetical protein